MTADLTTDSAALLERIKREMYEFDGESAYLLRGELTKAEAGNLMDLKKKGLVETQEEDGGLWVWALNREGA